MQFKKYRIESDQDSDRHLIPEELWEEFRPFFEGDMRTREQFEAFNKLPLKHKINQVAYLDELWLPEN